MTLTRMPEPGDRRWLVVAFLAISLVALAGLSFEASAQPPWLGLRAVTIDQSLTIVWVQPAGLAWDAGARPGDVVVGIRGGATPIPLDPVAAATTVSVARNGTVLTVSVSRAAPVSAERRLSFLVVAVCFFVVGSVAFVLSVETRVAWTILAFSVAAAAALLTAVATPFGSTWALGLEFLSIVSFGASAFLLFLAFPIDHWGRLYGRWAARVCLTLHLLLVISYLAAVLIDSSVYELIYPLVFGLLALDLVGASGLIALAAIRRSPDRPEARQVLFLVTFGTLTGVTPFVLLVLVPPLFGQAYLFPPDLAILSIVLLPASLGVAVLSRQFLGITRLVRRGLVALGVWTALLAGYSGAFDVIGHEISLQAGLGPALPYLSVGAIASVAGTFPVIEGWLRHTLERALFRDVYDYAKTLRDLSFQTARLTGPEAIAQHVLASLGETLDLSWAALAFSFGAATGTLYRWGECPDDIAGDLEKQNWRLDSASSQATFHEYHYWGLSGRHSVLTAPLIADGVSIGAFAIGPKRHDVELLPGDRMLVATVAPFAAAALQSTSLVNRLEEQIEALADRERVLAALSEKLIQVQEDERRSIAQDLHDDPLQRAILLTRELQKAPLHPQIERWRWEVEEIIVSLRATCTGLRPVVLDDLGLVGGLEWLATNLSARSDLAVSLVVETADSEPFGRLRPSLEIALYRVAQEALNNCLKHAQASQIIVTARRDADSATLSIVDNGRGYRIDRSGETHELQLGIHGMRERLRPWGGRLTIEDSPSGGTIVCATITLGGNHDR